MSTIDGKTIEERGGPERACTGRHTVDGHQVTCVEVALEADFCPACHESAWAEKLAAAEAALEKSRKTIYISTWDFIEHAEMLSIHSDIEGKNLSEVMSFLLNERIEQKTALAAAEARIRELGSIGNAREAEVAAHMEARYAAEERARKLEEALKDEIGWLSDMGERTQHLVTPASCRERAWKLAAALTPPPEAEKRGEGGNDV